MRSSRFPATTVLRRPATRGSASSPRPSRSGAGRRSFRVARVVASDSAWGRRGMTGYSSAGRLVGDDEPSDYAVDCVRGDDDDRQGRQDRLHQARPPGRRARRAAGGCRGCSQRPPFCGSSTWDSPGCSTSWRRTASRCSRPSTCSGGAERCRARALRRQLVGKNGLERQPTVDGLPPNPMGVLRGRIRAAEEGDQPRPH